jgi:SAM-dependent methyltransferase
MSAGWEDRASQWLAWARTPGHDAYWRYRGAFLDLVPPPAGRTLEVGCGEGRVARDLAARGHRVTALDASPTLVAAAAERDPASSYLVADACALPFGDAAFDLVVAYNVLMDVQDMPRAVGEAARVLAPTGCLCACVTHPATDAGAWRPGPDADVPDYLAGGSFAADDERDGLRMRWEGRRYSLEHYSRALEEAGLLLDAIREPRPDPADGPFAPWARVPMFLMLRARRAADPHEPV